MWVIVSDRWVDGTGIVYLISYKYVVNRSTLSGFSNFDFVFV